MEFTAKQIADVIGGRVEGDENAKVHTFAKIEEGKEGTITFLSNPKYTHFIYETKASIVLINNDVELEHPVSATLIRVPNAYECVAKLMQMYAASLPKKKGIDPLAFVSKTAEIGKDVYIGPFTYVGEGVKIGDGCLIYPHVTIYDGCQIGNNVTIHAGAVIGADGFGFAPNQEGYDKIPQMGIVVIEDNVEIGANTCVDRSTMGQTVLHKGVKLDNLIQVAHNCEIGENTVMSAQAGMAGSTKIGAWCMVGGQAGFSGHITIADKTFVGAQSGVISNTKGNGEQLIGAPAINPKVFFKARALDAKLPDMYRQIAQLQRELDELKKIVEEGEPVIDAIAENVIDTQRGTVLGKGDVRISTVEHGLAALYAMGIDNCSIQVNGPEFPILDGSAFQYVEKIKEVGIEEQNAPKDWYIIRKKIEVKDEQTGSCITILPDEQFSLTAMCSFESKFINSQFATLETIEDFETEIAAARTFVFVRDIEPLLQANLIKGGDMDNAIVIYERQTTQERLDMLADMLHVEHRDANELGYIQHKPLVWENECTRHKLLDIIGDMALIGKPIKGRIIATRPGHTINNKFARQMRKEIRKHEIQAPIYDPNEEPLMDVNKIRELLPHRYPMQLVDKVISLGANTIVGIKNVTANEPFFQGHFPEEPVMPGVLQIEAMAQCGGLLVLNTLEEPERWSTYFMKIDDVKFRQKVVPGDTLLFKVDLLAPVRHGISSMKGYIFVGDHVVAEATFTAQIVKNK